MFPGMNKKMMERAMKQLGVKQEELAATEVIIKTPEGSNIIIRDPQVMKVNMMGQETFQITGTIEEERAFSEEDIKTVMEQAHVDEATARKALENAQGDLAKAILDLTGK